jgi:hypothetical protein
MLLNGCIGREYKLALEISKVRFQTGRGATVGPVDDDVRRVALRELIPLLAAVDPEVQVVEVGQVRLFQLGVRWIDPLTIGPFG